MADPTTISGAKQPFDALGNSSSKNKLLGTDASGAGAGQGLCFVGNALSRFLISASLLFSLFLFFSPTSRILLLTVRRKPLKLKSLYKMNKSSGFG